jgi:predicted O-methyltransferase YrrM
MSLLRKIGKFSRGIKLLIQKPALLNVLLDNEDLHHTQVIEQFGLVNGLPEVLFEELAGDAPLTVNPFAFLDGGSMPTDLALLRQLAIRIKAEHYFEIGTWRGESVSNVAEVVKNCCTLNLSEAQMHERGWEERYIRLHGFFSKQNPNIQHVVGDSRTFNFKSYEQKQDLVFVDGDHHFDSVVNDTQTAFNLLKGEKSIIVWHDYGHSPETIRWNILHAILLGTPPEKRKFLYAVSNTLCAVYIPEQLQTRTRINPQTPDSSFSIILKQHKI